MTACVACETALHDYQENVSTGQTHGQTDGQTRQTKLSLCAAMLRRRHKKTTTLEKMTAQVIFWIRIYSEFRRNLFSANAMYIYMVILFRLAGNTAINFTRILTRPYPGTCDVSEV